MPEELKDTVNSYRNNGVDIQDEEIEMVYQLCQRKMEVGKISNKEEYLPILFKDELRNYLFRRVVNATSLVNMVERRHKKCVTSVI